MKFPRWELKHTSEPLDTRAYGGGGGDGGAQQMRDEELARQRKVQTAVDAINTKFGIAPTGESMGVVLGAAPDRAAFTKAPTEGSYAMQGENGPTVYTPPTPGGFDDAGFNQALAEYEGRKTQVYGAGGSDAAQNKATRDTMYADIAGAVKDTAMRDLDRQYGDASRRNKFGLARSGLLQGSVDAESGGQLQELYGEGKLKATQAGIGAASELRGNDERTRQNLISLAQSGLDTGTASSMAAGQMAAAADTARAGAAGSTVGRLFDDLSQAYVTNQVTKARYPAGQQQQPSGYGTSVFSPSRYTGTAAP